MIEPYARVDRDVAECPLILREPRDVIDSGQQMAVDVEELYAKGIPLRSWSRVSK